MAEKEFVGLKLDLVDLIALDTHAKNAGVNRTDFIKLSLSEKFNKSQLEKEAKREATELQKVYEAITEMNANLIVMKDELKALSGERMKRVYDRLGELEKLIKRK